MQIQRQVIISDDPGLPYNNETIWLAIVNVADVMMNRDVLITTSTAPLRCEMEFAGDSSRPSVAGNSSSCTAGCSFGSFSHNRTPIQDQPGIKSIQNRVCTPVFSHMATRLSNLTSCQMFVHFV